MTILDFKMDTDLACMDRLNNLEQPFKQKGIKHDEAQRRPLESKNIDPARGKDILSEVTGDALLARQGRSELRKVLQDATEGVKEYESRLAATAEAAIQSVREIRGLSWAVGGH